MSKTDEINALYRDSKILYVMCRILFITNVVLSIVVELLNARLSHFIIMMQIFICFMYMVLSIFDDGVLWFKAESARRKDSIQTAFNVDLDIHKTQGYYNNKIKNPELSYAANQFESVFFTKEISEKMSVKCFFNIIFSFAVLIFSCRFVHEDGILLVVAQSLFSASVLETSIRTFIFMYRIKQLYDAAYHEFITVGINSETQLVWLRYFCVEYESLKAHYRIRLDECIFNKLNMELSKEWEKLVNKIKIGFYD